MNNLSLTDETKKAILIAQSIAKEYSNPKFAPAHLLRAILHKEFSLREYLEQGGKDFYFMEDWADVRIESSPKGSKVDEPKGEEKIADVFVEADNIRIKLSKDSIDLICVLGAISTPGIAFSYDQLKTLPVTVEEIMNSSIESAAVDTAIGKKNGSAQNGSPTKGGALFKYCIDKTNLAKQGKLETITGRDKETRMISEILGRRSKPNVIITGEPGVGKTALVNGFVNLLISGKVPDNLKGAAVFELDTGAFIAGASYKGEAEDRMKNIIKEIAQFDKPVLFIDNFHSLLDKNGATPGLANILKPELTKGELTIIGATSNDQYRKHIESDEAFTRLFEMVKVEEPDELTTSRMLKLVMPAFEAHHKLKLSEDVIPESVRLAKRYLKERSLPDSAIDLIDRTMSAITMMTETSKDEIEAIEISLKDLNDNRSNHSDEDFLVELKWTHDSMKNKISSVLFGQIEEEQDIDKLESIDAVVLYLNELTSKLKELSATIKSQVEKTDIAAVVSHKTGIPLGKLQSQEREKLMGMEDLLKKRVVGQDHAVKAICEAILESRSGLSRPGQPIGSFFLLGPTGTGKTELAKSLAEFLFNDEASLIRFDMSEFKEEHSAALLYGAPPGYVGYEEGGMLVNKIRQQPYAVVLFDEIEKAHPSVFDLFLQILDEGKLHDRLGKEGDFSNSVILFTSNIGSDFVVDSFGKDIIPKSNDLMEIMTKYFRPEFLARLTEIIPFSPITEKIVLNIFNIQLKSLLKSLERQGISLKITDKAKEFLAQSGFTPKYGARPLAGVIRMQIRRPLSRMIISGELKRGNEVLLNINDNNELIWEIK
ncbi:MAG TPA: ATP-dependent Clp protease ATP-binding subunit [Bacteroidia bacterium]|nr:ATP-dependent Clp protease ATP-binding subunit [Bacteroidia bacterium]